MKKTFLHYGIMISLLALLIYTRFVGLDWGMPYPMHPDENNLVRSILQLSCPDLASTTCLHPDFFAYGQFSIYLASVLAHILAFIYGSEMIGFREAAGALRIISATASVLTAVVMLKTITSILGPVRRFLQYVAVMMIIFVPGFIQFAHFGTTESLLMLYFSLLLYFAIRFLRYDFSLRLFITMSGMIFGIALGTKVSSAVFAAVPVGALVFKVFEGMQLRPFFKLIFAGIQFAAIATIFFILTSPYNLLDWSDFMGSMNYESSVGLGTYRAFYTRQFEYTIPFIFQFMHVFPYALGGPLYLMAIMGFIFLPFTKVFTFMRLQIIIFLIPTMIIYAKWSRFVSPVFPAISLLGILFIVYLLNKPFPRTARYITTALCLLIMVLTIVPGLAYLTIYRTPDVRFIASKWMYNNIPSGSYILAETANVVDLPLHSQLVTPPETEGKQFRYITFNFYDIDHVEELQQMLKSHLQQADYIVIPTRRIFYNHTCYRPVEGKMVKVYPAPGYDADICDAYQKQYPLLNHYYDMLFAEDSSFQLVAEFDSYPRIELFGKILFTLPDEASEETWSVFDHPVVRIYKKI